MQLIVDGKHERRGWRRWSAVRSASIFGAISLALASAGCEVTNPGPIQDQFLTDPQSHQPFVSGAGFKLLRGLKNLGYDGAVVIREVLSGGQIGEHGYSIPVQFGHIEPGTYGSQFAEAQEARWIAEEAIRRLSEVGTTKQILAQAYIWAGYANRVLGENYCIATIDGGPPLPGKTYFERAESHFTNAIDVATAANIPSLAQNARAGRAQVRMWLNDWAGAAADAGHIPNEFVFALKTDGSVASSRNRFYWGSTYNGPYRSYTVWNTFFDGYYNETGDPRTPWAKYDNIPFSVGALAGYGQVPYYNQLKYTGGSNPIRLASGREMRLIEAEARLQNGQWQDAMQIINAVRATVISDKTGQPLQPWAAASLADAWAMLKRERAIELWLEGRRLGDVRRWKESNTPGVVDWPNFETLTPFYSQYQQSYCFDIPNSERGPNPHLEIVK